MHEVCGARRCMRSEELIMSHAAASCMRSMRSRSMHEEGHEEKDHDEEHELHVRVMSMRRSMKSHDA
jgi:hypothetical protein